MIKVITQVKTFHNKMDWRHFDVIKASVQINKFIRDNPNIEVVDIRPWSSFYVCVTYKISEETK